MEVGLLQKQLTDLTSTLMENGFLDRQFVEIQSLSDSNNPDFALEVINDYFEDAQKLVNEIHKAIQHQFASCKEISDHAHRLKGSSASVGLKGIADLSRDMQECCDRFDINGCFAHLQQVKCALPMMKNELQKIFDLQKQILAAGGSLPRVQG